MSGLSGVCAKRERSPFFATSFLNKGIRRRRAFFRLVPCSVWKMRRCGSNLPPRKAVKHQWPLASLPGLRNTVRRAELAIFQGKSVKPIAAPIRRFVIASRMMSKLRHWMIRRRSARDFAIISAKTAAYDQGPKNSLGTIFSRFQVVRISLTDIEQAQVGSA